MLADVLARHTARNGVQDPCWANFARKVRSGEGEPVDYRQEKEACQSYLSDSEWDGNNSLLYGAVSLVYEVMVALVPPDAKSWETWAPAGVPA
jgi:hypothetical protein